MTKIKEIIDKHDKENGRFGQHISDNTTEISIMMKEYAEYYAKECLEMAKRIGISMTKINLPPHQ